MEFWLSLGLSFETARQVLQQLRAKEPDFADPKVQKRLMLFWDRSEGILKLAEFALESAIASIDRGQPIIPLWLDRIHQTLNQRLKV